jgi:hypothetical protein
MEFLTMIFAWAEHIPAWLSAITLVIASATSITALTPSKADDKIINAVLKVLNVLAGNFWGNKNADVK